MNFSTILFIYFLILSKIFSQEFAPTEKTDFSKNSFNVLSYDIDLDLTNSYKEKKSVFEGRVTLRIKTLSDSLNSIVLDAIGLNIDTVKSGSKVLKFEETDTSLCIRLDRYFTLFETLSIDIIYRRDFGSHPNVGYYFYEKSSTIAENIAFISSYPQATRYWLPCKDDQSDKALITLSLKIPKDYNAVSNGYPVSEIITSDSKIIRFNDEYPISTYTFVFFVSKFTKIEEDVELGGAARKISFFCWKNDSLAAYNVLKELKKILFYFSNIFGGYPFSNLKYLKIDCYPFLGYSAQSVIILNRIPFTEWEFTFLQAHELAHQWFGSSVNAYNWNDNWLHESFTTFWGYMYQNSILGENYNKERFIRNGKSYIENDELVTPNFGSGKGTVVLEMLRYIVGDTVMSKIFEKYVTDFAYSNASTKDFNNIVNQVTNKNFNWFFDEWVFNLGHPIYDIKWNYNPDNKELLLNIDQLQTARDVFIMPLEFRINYTQGDTLIKLFNDSRSQNESIPLQTEPLQLIFDPDAKILIKELHSITSVQDVDNKPLTFRLEQNYPNPFNLSTTISYELPQYSNVTLKVFDLLGKEVSELVNKDQPAGKYTLNFNAQHLPSGIYIYRLQAGTLTQTRKLTLLK